MQPIFDTRHSIRSGDRMLASYIDAWRTLEFSSTLNQFSHVRCIIRFVCRNTGNIEWNPFSGANRIECILNFRNGNTFGRMILCNAKCIQMVPLFSTKRRNHSYTASFAWVANMGRLRSWWKFNQMPWRVEFITHSSNENSLWKYLCPIWFVRNYCALANHVVDEPFWNVLCSEIDCHFLILFSRWCNRVYCWLTIALGSCECSVPYPYAIT